MSLDYTSLLAHYEKTGNYLPLLDGAPKADNWGHGTPPQFIHLLPTGKDLLIALRDAYQNGKPLPAELEWADWSSIDRKSPLFT